MGGSDHRDGNDGDLEASHGKGQRSEAEHARVPRDSHGTDREQCGRKVHDEQGEAERGDERHHLRLERHRLLAPKFAMQETKVEEQARAKAQERVDRGALERIETEGEAQEVGAVRAEHDEFAVGDVHDLRDAPDEVQPMRDHGEDAALEQAVREILQDDGPGVDHGPSERRLSFRCTDTGPGRPPHPPGRRP